MDKRVKFRDIEGFYTDEGNGIPIVLIHGFCEDGSIWNGLKEALSNHFRVITPDLPGYRNTSASKEDLSMEWMADFIKAIFDHENINKPIIIGHSMGGYITLALTEKYPDIPDRIGLVHSHCFADDDEKKKGRKKAIDFIAKNGTEGFVDELYSNLFGKKFLGESKATVDKLKAYGKEYPAETIIAGLRAMMKRPHRDQVLKTFKYPVLFILGMQDKAIPYKKSLEQCGFPEITNVHILDNASHMSMIEEPNKILEMLEEFAKLRVS